MSRESAIRPEYVIVNARNEYERTYRKYLEKNPGKIVKAAKAAMKTYDRTLRDYDKRNRNSSNS